METVNEKPISDLTLEDYAAELAKYGEACTNYNNENSSETRKALEESFDRVMYIILKVSNCDQKAVKAIVLTHQKLEVSQNTRSNGARSAEESLEIMIYPFNMPRQYHSIFGDFPPHKVPTYVRESHVAAGLIALAEMISNIVETKPETYLALRYELDQDHLFERVTLRTGEKFLEFMPQEDELRQNADMNKGYFVSKPFLKTRVVTLANNVNTKHVWMVLSGGQDYTYVFTNNKEYLPAAGKPYDDIFLVTNVVIGFVDRVAKLTISRMVGLR